jgi:hypothetical protein
VVKLNTTERTGYNIRAKLQVEYPRKQWNTEHRYEDILGI